MGYYISDSDSVLRMEGWGKYHKPETGYVVQSAYAVGLLYVCSDVEPTRGKYDGIRDPESTIRGESSRPESVSNRHFPIHIPLSV